MKKTVRKATDLCKYLGVPEDFDKFKRQIYKSTDCGAWVNEISNGIQVGSIVEGVDGDGTQTYTLYYPFDYESFWSILEVVEKESDEIWKNTHGCEDCPEDPETGYHVINPNCPTCHGEGTII